MKKIVAGIVAHVDSGKTTLSEAILYKSGSIRKLGRVDKRDAFLDTNQMERERGITIFSKQAQVSWENTEITLLDTPGHVDFAAEMERTLQVLDYAILVISGADGVQGHTETLWKLLERYQIPVFLFVNKMDQEGTDRERLMAEIKEQLEENCVCFTEAATEEFYESVAMSGEEALEQFLAEGKVSGETIQEYIQSRKLFPCVFGSALKLEGVEELLDMIDRYAKQRTYPAEFGAKVFKITRDGNQRLTHLKVTGGALKVRDLLDGEKVSQIRIYAGEKYETADEVQAGSICSVTGLSESYSGEGFGYKNSEDETLLEPVMTYRLETEEDYDAALLLPKLRQLEEEEPKLHVTWKEELREIQVQVMGEVQLEILKRLIEERFGVKVSFGAGNIVYKETIANTVEGVGHYEPLRHYAEVHLLMEPGERGSGLVFKTDCSEDILDKNWQRLILTHLGEREHPGVLTGSAITDMKITLKSGKAHLKHTEGGDFRQAVYRGIRQGLMQAESVLLEPCYSYRLEVPTEQLGRAIHDIEQMHGSFEPPEQGKELTILKGSVPVAALGDYQREVTAYTRGKGRLSCTLEGYRACHNTEEVVEQIGYDAERDEANPSGSVFCSHGAGFYVPWKEVPKHMHLPSCLKKDTVIEEVRPRSVGVTKEWMTTEEVDAIIEKSVSANKREKQGWERKQLPPRERITKPSAPKKQEKKEEYLLVDGYNIIFAWEELRELAKVTIDGARGRLMDILCNYQGIRKCNLIVVFDAYRVQGHPTEISDYHNIHVVFTKEAETADQYIEKFAHENGKKYDVTVATSDGLEQIIIRGQGCRLISARELEEEIARKSKEILENYRG